MDLSSWGVVDSLGWAWPTYIVTLSGTHSVSHGTIGSELAKHADGGLVLLPLATRPTQGSWFTVWSLRPV